MAGEVKSGRQQMLYIDLAGVGEGTWALADKVGDVTHSGSRAVGEVKERGSDDVGVVIGPKSRPLSVQLTRRPGNAVYDGLHAAWLAGTYVGVAVMNGPILTVGSKGYQADCHITKWDDNQASENPYIDVEVQRAADSPTDPADVTVSS